MCTGSSREPCTPGFYSIGSQSSCTQCPLGFYCPTTTRAEMACPPGTYCPVGSVTYIPCPPGSSCTDPKSIPSTCGSGDYSIGWQTSCTPCPNGFYCPGGSNIPIVCPSGYYSTNPTRSTDCTICPANSYCPSSTNPPKPVPLGFYSLAGMSYYIACASGSVCGTVTKVCDPGQYLEIASGTCKDCEQGVACPTLMENDRYDCPLGTYSPGKLTECITCPAGFSCSNSAATPCDPGSFSQHGSTTCTNCPAGYYCPYANAPHALLCPPGTYSTGKQTVCTICPDGTACASRVKTLSCEPTEIATTGSHVCIPCPGGSACSGLKSTTPCADGEYSPAGSTGCMPCDSGSYCPSPVNNPILCPPGTFSAGTGNRVCTSCPMGTFSMGGKTSCTDCGAGYYCPGPHMIERACPTGTYSLPKSITCLPCPKGKYCESPCSTPANCPAGYYCDYISIVGIGGLGKIPCPAGTYSGTSGVVSVSACQPCPQGKYCMEGSIVGKDCPAGYLCPLGTKYAFDHPCPPGTFGGGGSLTSCTDCTAGHYCPPGSSVELICPPGYCCPAKTGYLLNTLLVPPGKYTEFTACSDPTFPGDCLAGAYCPVGSVFPVLCPPGTYNAATGKTALSDCTKCTAGKICTKYGATTNGTPCPMGYYCPVGNTNPYEHPCPAGTFGDTDGLGKIDDCQECPAGKACSEGANPKTNPLQRCAPGYFCIAGSTTPKAAPCPGGLYSTTYGATKADDCKISTGTIQKCLPGYYCLPGSDRLTGECQEGYFCPEGSSSPTEKPCSGGTYSNLRGLSLLTQCTDCPEGYYCPNASTEPLPCPGGTFNTAKNGGSLLSCSPCTAGYRCPEATGTPIPCGLGMYSGPHSIICFECIPGFDCSSTTTPEPIYTNPKNCPAGSYCVKGVAGVSNVISCPPNYFCAAGLSRPTPCPPGKHTMDLSGKTSCIDITSGMYVHRADKNIEGKCQPGYFCPSGSWAPDAQPCPRRKFINRWGGTALTDCSDCPEGHYCLEATANPIICPHGYFCVAKSESPEKCPIGTYGPRFGLVKIDDCLPCPAGRYCSLPGLPAPEGVCDAGYYCESGAMSSTPADILGVGGKCPAGGFCEAGSRKARSCPPGRYNLNQGGRDLEACQLCPPGHFCTGSSLDDGSNCVEGYYCPSGSYIKNMNPALPGTYTRDGAFTTTPCPEKEYNPYYAQSQCLPCPAGFLCTTTGNKGDLEDCPKGKYCDIGQSLAKECPKGTFNPNLNAKSLSDCILCPPGKFCSNTALTRPGDGTCDDSVPVCDDDCDAGYYCLIGSVAKAPEEKSALSTANYGPCPEGYYCPAGISKPLPCPPGTYSDETLLKQASDCKKCPIGYYCETSGQITPTGVCEAGYYCKDEGSAVSRADLCPIGYYCPGTSGLAIKCAAGTFQDEQGQTSCKACPAGFFCPEGQGPLTALNNCPPGYYCPQGTVNKNAFPCPIGRYNPISNAYQMEQCLYCDPGHACLVQGNAGGAGDIVPCDPGYYCVSGSPTTTPPSGISGVLAGHGNYCPLGAYCPAGSAHYRRCPGGKVCPQTRLSAPTGDCQAGYYCRLGASSATPTSLTLQGGDICPKGYYCPTASDSPTPCPPGTYNPYTGMSLLTDCLLCPSGKFCRDAGSDAPTGDCDVGYYCKLPTSATVGFTIPNPPSNLCHIGHFCPAGTLTEQTCVDSYQDLKGQGQCKKCPKGYKCTTISATLCQPRLVAKSFFCPEDVMDEVECPAGTYNVRDKTDTTDDCKKCPKGNYCPLGGVSPNKKIIPCQAGYYCNEIGAADSTGSGKCPPGYYCPAGTEIYIPCPAGKYCDEEALTDTDLITRECAKGYFCRGKATSSTPTDGLTGQICPAGYYCPQGTKSPVACPIGFYRSTLGGESLADCLPCTAGKICPARGTSTPGDPCPSGYYCPQGSSGNYEVNIPCPIGARCPAGSSNYEVCPDKTYQDRPTSDSCKDCPERYFCKNNNNLVLASKPTICPAGAYCLARSDKPIDCPISTFSLRKGLKSESECEPCTPGFYCSTPGAIAPCDAGYYCIGGSKVGKPKDSTGNICTKGYYCPVNSVAPLPCPPGTFNDKLGLTSASLCTPCPQGYYCPLRGATSMDLKFGSNDFKCLPGYVCLGGSSIPNPTDVVHGDICSAGKYCQLGSSEEIKCERGTYNPDKGQSKCLECPAGKVCPLEGMILFNDCAAGFFCPAGSYSSIACPAGTYSPFTGLSAKEQCLDCEPGQYCTGGLSHTNGDCAQGFVCPRKSPVASSSNIYSFAANTPGLCPMGYTCPVGCSAPVPCPVGTYKPIIGDSLCQSCPIGKYCDELGLIAPSKLCAPGHLCTGGATHPRPKTSAEGGKLCSKGHFCPEGATIEISCSAGTFEPREGSSQCQPCPAGFTCGVGCITPISCPVKYYCPKGSITGILCPDGTFGRAGHDQLERADQCTPCPSGRYCRAGEDTDDCAAGFYCDIGATSGQDTTKQCPTGHYCLKGAKLPIRCADGKFNIVPGAPDSSYCIDCTPGYYCIAGLSIPIECPMGHYCVTPASKPTECPKGTYQPKTAKEGVPYNPPIIGDETISPNVDYTTSTSTIIKIITPCLYCPAGTECYEKSTYDPSMYPCPVGNYCPAATLATYQNYVPTQCPIGTYRNTTGAKDASECFNCPGGYYCELGKSIHPQPCRGGYYCPPKSDHELDCPAKYYCPPVTEIPIICPAAYYCAAKSEIYKKCDNGFFCPEGTDIPESCPNGYIGSNNPNNIDEANGCTQCTKGYYSLANGNSLECKVCTQGYVCLGGTNTDRPVDPALDGGVECPEGYYCPAGSYEPTPCPAGTYSTGLRKVSLEDCLPCAENQFNPYAAASTCLECGTSSYASPDRITCICKAKYRAYQVDNQRCLCKPQYEPVDGSINLDSTIDCQPMIYDRCYNSEVRDADGKCKTKDDCSECPNGEGTRSPGIGVCECVKVAVLDTICDKKCRDNSIKLTVNYDGNIQVNDPLHPNKLRIINTNTINNFFGKMSYSRTDSKIVSINVDNARGFSANYQTTDVLQNLYDAVLAQGRRLEEGRNLDTTANDGITNPVICLNSGDTLFFAITSTTDYPVYDVNNLLNSNPNFDYSMFTLLATKMASSNPVESFAFTFTQAGRYVFKNNANPTQLTIVGVMGNNLKCSDNDRYIQPMTSSSLLKLGLSQTEDIILTPDWGLIFGLIAAILIAVPLLVWFMRYFTNSSWIKKKPTDIKYREVNATGNYDDFVAKGKEWDRSMFKGENGNNELLVEEDNDAIGKPNEKEAEVIEMRKKENIEGVHEIPSDIFRELYKELQFHAKFVKDEFAKKAGMDSDNIRKVFDEVDRLKKLMQEKLQNIAKSYGKGIRLLFDEKPDAEGIIVDDDKLSDEENEEAKASSESEEEKKENIEFKHAIFDEMDERDQNDGNAIAEKIREEHIAVQNKLTQEEKEARDKFEREIRNNTKLSQEEKKSLLDDYDKANAKLKKLLVVEEQNSEDRLKQVLEQRRRRRKNMEDEIAKFEFEKQNVASGKDSQLIEIESKKKEIVAEVDADIEKERSEEMKKINSRKQQELQKVRDRFQKKLKSNLPEEERAEIFNNFNSKMKALEDELEEEQKGDIDKLNIMLDMKRQKRKAERETELKKREKELKEKKAVENEAINEKIRILNENLKNEQIEEMVKHVKAEDDFDHKEENINEWIKQAKANREQESEESKKVEKELQKQKQDLILKEQEEIKKIQEEHDAIEKKMNEEIVQVKNKKAELNAKLSKTSNASEKKALLEEFKKYQMDVAGQVRTDLVKQNATLADKIADRKRQRQIKEAEIRANKQNELDGMRNANRKAEEELKYQINEQKLKRNIEKIQMALTQDEVPFAVERLIDEKHQEELADLLKRQFEDKARALKEGMQELVREKIEATQKVNEECDMQAKSNKKLLEKGLMKKDEYDNLMKDLEEKKQNALKDVEFNYAQKQNNLEENKLMDIEKANSEEMAKLMNNQAIEKQKYMQQFVNDDFLKKLLAGDQEDLEREAQQYKAEVEANFAQRKQEIEDKKKKIEEILLNDDGKMKVLEAQAQKLLKNMEMIDKKREEQTKKMIQEQLASKEEELKKKGINEEEKKRILEEHQKELDRLTDEMEKERMRQREKLNSKLQEKLKQKEVLQQQREEQMHLMRKEEDKLLDEKVKEIQKERGIETEEQKDNMVKLSKKYDPMKQVFDKMKPLAGVDLEPNAEEENVLRGILESKKKDAKDYSKIDLSFELLFNRVKKLSDSVSVFTGLQFEQIFAGFLDLNSKLDTISSGNIPKEQPEDASEAANE